jgi:CheY-like chemotaxis protein
MGLVEHAGGHIHVETEPNRGTTFRVYLPSVKAEVVTNPAPLVLLPAGGRETVLVAEDEAGIRAMTRAYLEGLGYRVLEAADGVEAVRVSSEYSGVIDLVLTDVLMPGIRGDTAVEEIRKSRPATKAIFMSGYTDQDLASNGETTLQKPFDFPELGRRLREVLDTPRQ